MMYVRYWPISAGLLCSSFCARADVVGHAGLRTGERIRGSISGAVMGNLSVAFYVPSGYR